MNETLIMLKPDVTSAGTEDKRTSDILSLFDALGFRCIKEYIGPLSREIAKQFYAMHKDKKFFKSNIDFITSGNVVVRVLRHDSMINTINVVRLLVGGTHPTDAHEYSIRGMYGEGLPNNAIHASASTNDYLREKQIIFGGAYNGK